MSIYFRFSIIWLLLFILDGRTFAAAPCETPFKLKSAELASLTMLSGDDFVKFLHDHSELRNDAYKKLSFLSNDDFGGYSLNRLETTYFISLSRGQLAGVVKLGKSPYAEGTYWVMYVATHEDFKNLGVASAMLEKVFLFAQEQKITLQCSSSTEKGKLY